MTMHPPLHQCLLSACQQWNESTDADTATDGDWTGAYPAKIVVYVYATICVMLTLTILFSNSRTHHICVLNKLRHHVVGFNYQHLPPYYLILPLNQGLPFSFFTPSQFYQFFSQLAQFPGALCAWHLKRWAQIDIPIIHACIIWLIKTKCNKTKINKIASHFHFWAAKNDSISIIFDLKIDLTEILDFIERKIKKSALHQFLLPQIIHSHLVTHIWCGQRFCGLFLALESHAWPFWPCCSPCLPLLQ